MATKVVCNGTLPTGGQKKSGHVHIDRGVVRIYLATYSLLVRTSIREQKREEEEESHWKMRRRWYIYESRKSVSESI